VPKAERAVGQPPVAIREELIDGPCIYQTVEVELARDLPVIGVEHDLDVRMVKHVLEHSSVAMHRHVLEIVSEVAVIRVDASGDAGGHRFIQFGGIDAPLLPRVAAKELLVELAPDATDHDILGSACLGQWFGPRGKEFLNLARVEV